MDWGHLGSRRDVVRFQIKDLGISDRKYATLCFGQRIEVDQKIAAWKAGAKSAWVSQKRKSSAKAIADFKRLHDVDEFYCKFLDSESARDDVFEIFYKPRVR